MVGIKKEVYKVYKLILKIYAVKREMESGYDKLFYDKEVGDFSPIITTLKNKQKQTKNKQKKFNRFRSLFNKFFLKLLYK